LYCCKLLSPQLPNTRVFSPMLEKKSTIKTGSSPISNIGRSNPPSLFNAGLEASAIPPLIRPDRPPSSPNTYQSRSPRSKRNPSLSPRRDAVLNRSHLKCLNSISLLLASATSVTRRDMDCETNISKKHYYPIMTYVYRGI
jgi:hypothetical protein